MKKLSEYRDEEALDLLADLLEPISALSADEDFRAAFSSGKRMKAAKIALKNHKPEVMQILAACEGVPVEEYHCNILSVPLRFMELVSDKELVTGFTSQVQRMASTPSGPVTENTEEDGE